MDAKTRAEKIVTVVALYMTGRTEGITEDIKKLIATQIEEAERDETKRNRIILDTMIDKSYAEGFAAAREKAAGIADSHKPCEEGKCWGEIADEIRAMVP